MYFKKFRHYILLTISASVMSALLSSCSSPQQTNETPSSNSASDHILSEADISSSEVSTIQSAETESETPSEEETLHFSSFSIGETETKDGWTQTYVQPNNIDDTFVIDACLPDDYDSSISYPVIYLTDCYWRRENYPDFKALYETGKAKEFILIGIGYPDDYDFDTIRERDLLYGPDQFLDMIINGVLPYAESTYNIDASNRTFCGASNGGYFMCYSILQSNALTKNIFRNYILASPTLIELDNVLYLPEEEQNFIDSSSDLPLNIYITVGGAEDAAQTIRPTEKFAKRLENANFPNLNITYQVYDGLGHYEVWVPTLLDGIPMFLSQE